MQAMGELGAKVAVSKDWIPSSWDLGSSCRSVMVYQSNFTMLLKSNPAQSRKQELLQRKRRWIRDNAVRLRIERNAGSVTKKFD